MSENKVGVSNVGNIENKYIKKEVIKTLIGFLFIDTIVALLWGLLSPIVASDKGYTLDAMYWFLFAVVIGLIIVIPVILNLGYENLFVKNFSYKINERFIVIHSGVFTRKKVTLPFSRIQNINITQGVFDRIFNLYTVKIETASASGAANQGGGVIHPEGYIPGLKSPEHIEKVINKMVHEYTQTPTKVEGHIFTDNNLAFDKFIAYIISKMTEGEFMKTKIRELRSKHNNMTQVELAEKADVTRQTIIYLEQGKYVPSLTLAMKIARVFNVSIEEIFELDEEDYDKKKGSN
ncbi:MAG: PH domain-containing protein [Promethearchaeota archaeon]